MSMILRCVTCDDKLPDQYGGGPCCGGVQCKRYRVDPFADARTGRSLFEMRQEDWLVRRDGG